MAFKDHLSALLDANLGRCFPLTSGAISLTLTSGDWNSYTAPSDGWFSIQAFGSADVQVELGTSGGPWGGGCLRDAHYAKEYYPLRKGQTISYKISGTSVSTIGGRFCPIG